MRVNEVDSVFIEIIVQYVTLVNTSSMRYVLVLVGEMPSVVLMPNKTWYLVKNNSCVVTERVFPFMKQSASKASSVIFFPAVELASIVPKNRNYFSEESIKTTIEPLFF